MRSWLFALACFGAGGFAGHLMRGQALHGQNPVAPPPAAAAIPQELTSYRDVVKRVLPAVVSIDARTKVAPARGQMQLPNDPRAPEEFRKFFEGKQPPGAPREGFGSGFIIDPAGVIVTNYHVVAGAEDVTVQLADGRKFVTRDVKGDRKTDLAILRITPKDGAKLPALELGDSALMEIGDRVLAVGAPFGLAGSVTHGIISAKGRAGLNMNMYEDFLQTDAAINPGNSGGPLVSLDGKVIGINAAIKSRSGGFQGVGLAVPSNMARTVVKALLTDGVVRRGYLGVQIRDLAPEVGARLGVQQGTGVVVGEVYPDTPAARAGLKEGDVILAIAGTPIKDGRALQALVAGLPLKKATDVELVRDGKRQTLPVTIEEQPDEFGATPAPGPRPQQAPQGTSIEKLGLSVADLTGQVAAELGFRGEVRGVVVTQVQPGGVAAQAGLARGTVITHADRQPVASAAGAREVLERASLEKGILLQVRSPQGGTNYVLLQAGN